MAGMPLDDLVERRRATYQFPGVSGRRQSFLNDMMPAGKHLRKTGGKGALFCNMGAAVGKDVVLISEIGGLHIDPPMKSKLV